jgi:hypothetical protein
MTLTNTAKPVTFVVLKEKRRCNKKTCSSQGKIHFSGSSNHSNSKLNVSLFLNQSFLPHTISSLAFDFDCPEADVPWPPSLRSV